MAIGFPKPSKAARLRDTKTDKVRAARALTALYKIVYARDHYRCVACHAHVEPNGLNALTRAHPHHVIFRSQGGLDVTGNVCTLCPADHADVHEGRLWISGNADTQLTIRRAA